jgi:hypothetical protein
MLDAPARAVTHISGARGECVLYGKIVQNERNMHAPGLHKHGGEQKLQKLRLMRELPPEGRG